MDRNTLIGFGLLGVIAAGAVHRPNPRVDAKMSKWRKLPEPVALSAAGYEARFRLNDTYAEIEITDKWGRVTGGANATRESVHPGLTPVWAESGARQGWRVGVVELPAEIHGKGIGVWLYETLLQGIAQHVGVPVALTMNYPISGNAASVRMSLAKRYRSVCFPDPLDESMQLCIPTSIPL